MAAGPAVFPRDVAESIEAERFTMQPESETRFEVLSRICDAVLIASALLAVPAVGASLARIETMGWQPVMGLQVLIALAVWAVMLFRRRLSYGVRSWFTVGVLVSVALSGVASFGLASSAGAWIPFAGVLGAILLGHRAGALVLLSTVFASGVIGTSVIVGHRLPDFDLVAYMTSGPAWAAQSIAWLMVGGTCVVAIGVLNSYFVETVATTKQQAEALKQSQREYRDIFENMVDTIYRADLDGKILTISPSVVNMLGFQPEQLIGKKLAQFYVVPEKRQELLAELQATHGDVRNFEAQLLDRNGEPQWISTNTRYWKNVDGSVLGVEGVARNITSQKAAEEALRRSQKMEALGHLTGGIAHDFNNLLSVIIGNADLLEEDADSSAPARENAKEIIKAAEQGTALTRRLLAFSRPEMLAAEPTAVDAVILDLDGMMRRTLGATVRLRLDLATQDASTLIDSHQFGSSLLNLAINARDAMPNGGELTIATANTTIDAVAANSSKGLEPGEYLSVVVRDTGTGMTDETIRNAFEPFFTTKPLGTGNGLGLSMVYSFAIQSRGHISIASKWGEGTSVTLLLPRSDEAPRVLETPILTPEPPRMPARILVVEDAPALRALAIATLQGQGHEVVAAADGREALDLLRNDAEINLLFTDVVLPGGIDGFEIAREALRIKSDIKILLTSGYALKMPTEDDPIAKVPIVYKPYHRAQLLTQIEEVLTGSWGMGKPIAPTRRSASYGRDSNS
jgi:PAS domain S-box-containing protein